MVGETCPYCGKIGVRRMSMHQKYCSRKPLDNVTQEDAEAKFEERAQVAEQSLDERTKSAGRRRTFMPSPTSGNVKFPTTAWYLRPNGALPEDAFIATSAWSAEQKEDLARRGFIEVTPSKSFLMRREDGSVMGGVVMLDPPPRDRWQRILKILDARRPQVLAYETQRLEDEEAVAGDALDPAARAASRSRVRTYGARVAALKEPYPSEELYKFFEEEARKSRRDQTADSSIRRIVDERLDELIGVDIE